MAPRHISRQAVVATYRASAHTDRSTPSLQRRRARGRVVSRHARHRDSRYAVSYHPRITSVIPTFATSTYNLLYLNFRITFVSLSYHIRITDTVRDYEWFGLDRARVHSPATNARRSIRYKFVRHPGLVIGAERRGGRGGRLAKS